MDKDDKELRSPNISGKYSMFRYKNDTIMPLTQCILNRVSTPYTGRVKFQFQVHPAMRFTYS